LSCYFFTRVLTFSGLAQVKPAPGLEMHTYRGRDRAASGHPLQLYVGVTFI
jgi:hypothetical protein